MRYKSFLSILFLIAAAFVLCSPAAAQSRVSRIYRPCSGSTTPASVSIDRAGNIAIAPCSAATFTYPGKPLTAQTTSNQNFISTQTPAATALSVTIPGAGNYEIDLVLHCTEGPGGFRADFAGTAIIGNFIGQWQGYAIDLTVMKGGRVTSAVDDFTDLLLANMDTTYTFRGSAEFTTGGTFVVRAAQSSSGGFQTTLERGSTLKLTKMN
jgi:hypothetical protein